MATGARVVNYVPMRTLEVLASEEIRPALEALPAVRWVGPVQPAHKIDASLEGELASHRQSRVLRVRVSFYPAEEARSLGELRRLGHLLGGDRGESYAFAEMEIPAGRLPGIARLPLVRRIERGGRRILPMGDRARFHSGLAAVADATFTSGLDPSLDGFDPASGFRVKYGHTDTGVHTAHADFGAAFGSGRITLEPGSDSLDVSSGHGTHTGATLIGDGGLSPNIPATPPGSDPPPFDHRWRGVQPAAALHHISFQVVEEPGSPPGIPDRQVFETHSEHGAHILSNSWGWGDYAGNPITSYEAAAAAWDEAVWDADDDEPGRQPLVAVFAAGNLSFNLLNGCTLFGGLDQMRIPPARPRT